MLTPKIPLSRNIMEPLGHPIRPPGMPPMMPFGSCRSSAPRLLDAPAVVSAPRLLDAPPLVSAPRLPMPSHSVSSCSSAWSIPEVVAWSNLVHGMETVVRLRGVAYYHDKHPPPVYVCRACYGVRTGDVVLLPSRSCRKQQRIA